MIFADGGTMTVGYDAGDRHRHTPQFARVRRLTAAVGRGDRSRFTRTAGVIATEMAAAVPDKVIEKFKKQIPVGRLGRPEEIARVVHFLAAGASAYITGQIWGVNGGMDM
jgi:NAD(P)-dependent dehydrogenase (short-subunit alcohol dehydrogenase family)